MKVLTKKDWFAQDGFPIAVARREPQLPFGIHRHEFSEIVIVTGGNGTHVTGSDQWELTAGDVFVISGNRAHGYRKLKQLRLINVLFDASGLPMQMGDLKSLTGYHSLFGQEPTWVESQAFTSRFKLRPPDLLEALNLVEQLERELQQRNSGFEIMANVIFVQLATFLSRCFSDAQPQSAVALVIAESLAYIDKHYAESITLGQLVRHSGMSRRHYLRSFEAIMGQTPIAFLIRLRIRHASRMLARENKSVTQIAFDVGFNDSNYFSRQFKSLTGTSPREYRTRYGTSE